MSRKPQTRDRINFAIDRGGTFTDVFAWVEENGTTYHEKLLSVAPNLYPDGPAEGIRRVVSRHLGRELACREIPEGLIGQVRMGTTVATNALLERKGAPCALLITRGFADLLQIGYQNRPALFDLAIRKPELLYREVVEIDERVRPAADDEKTECYGIDGSRLVVEKRPDEKVVAEGLTRIRELGIDSIAVVLLHAHIYPDHEKIIGHLAREIGFSQVSLSSVVNPQSRVVRRGDTAMVDAYLSPLITRYLKGFMAQFAGRLPRGKIFFMRSDGGLTAAERFTGSSAILSGPAGGVTGCAMTAYRLLSRPVIGFDMGGTSTDVCRYDGNYEITDEGETAGVRIQTPQLAINTVAAGGGSRLFYRHGMFQVGPESAGADPGPACYRKGGPLTITDANLVLGRLLPENFPAIFGPDGNEPLSREASRKAFARLALEINQDRTRAGRNEMGIEEIAAGFIEVANQSMARPIREISLARGHDLREHVLVCFGGAGGQHACGLAADLGIDTVYIHRASGILSAYGMAMASLSEEMSEPAGGRLSKTSLKKITGRFAALEQLGREKLTSQGAAMITARRYLTMRYQGTDTRLMIEEPADGDFHEAFTRTHYREFGFSRDEREVMVDQLRVRLSDEASLPPEEEISRGGKIKAKQATVFFDGMMKKTPVYMLNELSAGARIAGPALIVQATSTIVIEPNSTATITVQGDVMIKVARREISNRSTEADPVRLAIFSNLFMSIAEQMGRTLQRTAVSTNIKERCDFSCALFDDRGNLVANAPHQPVHLGAMGEAVKYQIRLRKGEFAPGEVIMSNHPAAGGSHLPDLTVISPVFHEGDLAFFIANRGHHADIGGLTPGSMPPFSKALADEGIAVKSFTLMSGGIFAEEQCRELFRQARRPADNLSDLAAQIAANRKGAQLLTAMAERFHPATVRTFMDHIRKNAEEASRGLLIRLAERYGRELAAADRMDDDTQIRARIEINPANGDTTIDFTGTGPAVAGNWNAPRAVTMSAILYVIRAMIAEEIPLNQGCLGPIRVKIPPGSILDPPENAAVAGGNVLTSQRVVDVLLKAFHAAAASQGCMNNLTIGDKDFGYYETIGGGSGAGPGFSGASGVHSHMTNTRITDPEILEARYPVILRRFCLRPDSGGRGRFRGGDGLVREFEFKRPLAVSILSERRRIRPFGMEGGEDGKAGRNILRRNGKTEELPGKCTIEVTKGDRLIIETPGGGGWGRPDAD